MLNLERIYIGQYKDLKLHFNVYIDNKNCEKFVNLTFFTFRTNQYLDILYNINDMPDMLKNIYEYVKNNNTVSLTEEGQYVFFGPCLKTGGIFEMIRIYKNDYDRKLTVENEFIYNKNISDVLVNKYIKSIYDDIKDIIIS